MYKINRDVPAGKGGKVQMICRNILKIGLIRYAKPVLIIGLIRYAKPVLKVGLIRYAKSDITHDHAKRAVMKQLCEINATF